MSGSKVKCSGIDEEGNAANFVETEHIIVKTMRKENFTRLYISSYV